MRGKEKKKRKKGGKGRNTGISREEGNYPYFASLFKIYLGPFPSKKKVCKKQGRISRKNSRRDGNFLGGHNM